MIPFSPSSILTALVVATLLAVRGVKKKSLSTDGAIAAFLVGFGSLLTGLRGFLLLIFYQIGSWATKYKKTIKQSKDATAAMEGTARGASQVFCCSIIAVALSLLRAIYCGPEEPIGEFLWQC